ncbi:unnamed protein product [Calypogeia fissa]
MPEQSTEEPQQTAWMNQKPRGVDVNIAVDQARCNSLFRAKIRSITAGQTLETVLVRLATWGLGTNPNFDGLHYQNG